MAARSGKTENKKENQVPQGPMEVAVVKGEEKILMAWKGPVRPFKKRGKEFFSTVLAVAVLLSIIFFFIEGVMPVIVIAAVVFLVYILSTVAPEEVEYKITNRGVKIGEKDYPWGVMLRFFFTSRWGTELLVVEMPGVFPGRLEMVLAGGVDKEKLKKVMNDYLPLEKTPPGWVDKAAGWLSERVPLEG